jgi:hypothetical protein
MVASVEDDGFFDTSAGWEANKALAQALDSLTPAEAALGRRQILAMLDEMPGALFVTKLELSGTGPAYKIARAVLKPTQRYWDIIAAVRAGNLNWDVQ